MFLTRRNLLKILALTPLIACSKGLSGKKQGATQKRVVALGDSLTQGFGAASHEAYPAILANITGWNVVNAGVSGDTSADVLKRLPEILSSSSDLILLGIGGNDFLKRNPDDETRKNIEKIIEEIQDKDIDIVLIAEPHFTVSALFGKMNDHPMYQEIASDKKIPLFSNAWSSILSDKSLKSDQIHANAAGYHLFAEKLADFLRKEGLF